MALLLKGGVRADDDKLIQPADKVVRVMKTASQIDTEAVVSDLSEIEARLGLAETELASLVKSRQTMDLAFFQLKLSSIQAEASALLAWHAMIPGACCEILVRLKRLENSAQNVT